VSQDSRVARLSLSELYGRSDGQQRGIVHFLNSIGNEARAMEEQTSMSDSLKSPSHSPSRARCRIQNSITNSVQSSNRQVLENAKVTETSVRTLRSRAIGLLGWRDDQIPVSLKTAIQFESADVMRTMADKRRHFNVWSRCGKWPAP